MGKKGKAKQEPPQVEVKDAKLKKKSSNVKEEIEDPKKPQRGLAIGENFGWTGKLPATLVHEHCQKQKWNKVIFDMRKTPIGFIGIVNLSWENPKTKEVIHIKMIPDSDLYQPKETTNEARHFAATYALHRINYTKNMKMLLPVIFRNYWSDLEAKRLETLKSNKGHHDNIYNENPFLVFMLQREKREKLEKEKSIREQNDAKARKPTINILSKNSAPKLNFSSDSKQKTNGTSSDKVVKVKLLENVPEFPRKVWANAPFIDFPSDIRVSIERGIKNHIDWILDSSHSQLDPEKKQEFTNQLLRLGFRDSHIQESLKYTFTFIDALEWLLFHIPEDDLPPFFCKRDEDSNVSLKISNNIQKEYLMKRLAESGFDNDEVVSTLKENNNQEIETAIRLSYKSSDYIPTNEAAEDGDLLWKQEIESIEVIGSNEIEFIEGTQERVVSIKLNPKNIEKNLLCLKLYRVENYPNDLPGIQLVVTNSSFKLANYIKLSTLRQLNNYIVDNGFIGDCFIFSIIEWLEENISKVIDNPGPIITDSKIRESYRVSSTSSTNHKKHSHQVTKSILTQKDIEKLALEQNKKLNTQDVKASIGKRSKLPAWNKKHELVSIINQNKVTLVTGETGSGKSTQIVQFILDDLNSKKNFESRIICTQPRRISTIGLAERISDERVNKLGNEVGYIIRGENKTNKFTRISFVTTGVLLRMLQSFLGSDSSSKLSIFDNLEYIFVDEVHERSVDSDFLLIILKRIMKKFKNLKVILMSATIDVEIFKNFFNTPVNHIHIEGRTFPIQDFHLDSILTDLDYTITNRDGEEIKPKADSQFFKSGTLNYDLISELCLNIDTKLAKESNDGSILVFLPGIMEINQCIRYIENAFSEENKKTWCLPLHSALSSNDQKRVFKVPSKGTRKIVVSTNVAETSITIPDCVVVVDSGRSKMMFYDANSNATKLIESWCSKAEIMQRRGRSGRITNGTCYHLYTKDTENQMLSQPIPEIKRTRLESLYLIVKSMGINKVEEFLNGGLDPPDASSLLKSKQFLSEIGALTNTEQISHLGRYLSYLPADLQSGKLLIFGCIFGCLDICLTLASLSVTGSPFLNSFENREAIKQAKSKFSKQNGDLVVSALAYNAYETLRLEGKNTKKFLSENYLSYLTVKEITSTRTQYLSLLKDIGFVPLSYNTKDSSDASFISLNKNKDNFQVISAIITGAGYPNVARVQFPDAKYFQSSAGAIEIDLDIRQIKFWIRNDAYITKVKADQDIGEDLPASRAFIHPSSLLFSDSNKTTEVTDPDLLNEDGSVNMEKARSQYKADLTPQVSGTGNSLKQSFVVYGSSSHTSKLYLRDLTPTSTLSTLLFGGDITYDLSNYVSSGKTSPGIVLDSWMPVRTWCKNGVLIKRLKTLLDKAIEDKLSNPSYTNMKSDLNATDDIISVVEKVLYKCNR